MRCSVAPRCWCPGSRSRRWHSWRRSRRRWARASAGPRSVGWSRSSPATAVTASAASTAVGGPLSPARPTRPSGGAMVSLGTCGSRRSTSRPSAPVTTSTAVGCRRCTSASHGGSVGGGGRRARSGGGGRARRAGGRRVAGRLVRRDEQQRPADRDRRRRRRDLGVDVVGRREHHHRRADEQRAAGRHVRRGVQHGGRRVRQTQPGDLGLAGGWEVVGLDVPVGGGAGGVHAVAPQPSAAEHEGSRCEHPSDLAVEPPDDPTGAGWPLAGSGPPEVLYDGCRDRALGRCGGRRPCCWSPPSPWRW